MSRDISASNLTEINSDHVHEVLLVKLEFDTPAYVHSGIGTITYDSNDYLGVGQFGSVSNATESEDLRPSSLTLELSGVDASLITEALNSGNYGDIVTMYIGYRQDDGTLVADPWIFWRGKLEFTSVSQGETNVVSITVQHDLAELEQVDGARFSDEDQARRFTGDLGLEFTSQIAGVKLQWGGGPVWTSGGGGSDRGPGPGRPRRQLN